VSRLKDKLLIV